MKNEKVKWEVANDDNTLVIQSINGKIAVLRPDDQAQADSLVEVHNASLKPQADVNATHRTGSQSVSTDWLACATYHRQKVRDCEISLMGAKVCPDENANLICELQQAQCQHQAWSLMCEAQANEKLSDR